MMLRLFDTGVYFTNNKKLWVHPGFVTRIVGAYPEPLMPRGLMGVRSVDLKEDLSSKEVVKKIGGPLMPDQIAAILNLQPGGAPGRLLHGDVNWAFMTGKDGQLFAVALACLPQKGDKWGLFAGEFVQEGILPAGARVFFNT